MTSLTKNPRLLIVLSTIIVGSASCPKQPAPGTIVPELGQKPSAAEEDMTKAFEVFLAGYLPEVKRLEKEASLAAWNAYSTGGDEAYAAMEQSEIAIRKFHSDAKSYALLKTIKESGKVADPLLARQLTLIYNDYLANQIPPDLMEKMVKLSTEIEKTFNEFRGTVDGKEYTRNDVIKVLSDSKDNALRQKVWEAHKEVGPLVADRLIELIKLRNEAARHLGFDDYRQMQLVLQEHDPAALDAIFQELEEKTEEPFVQYKGELDKTLAKRLKVKPDKLRPWHYADPFFQEAPQLSTINYDAYFTGKDLVAIASAYYGSFGLDVAPIVERSDLFPKPGKSEHAFCFTIDREEPDIRVLCNIEANAKWMDTLLHELGHGLYDRYYTPDLPWRLREPAHIFTTEGIAQLFGEMTRNPNWLKEVVGLSDKEAKKLKTAVLKQKALGRLIFARWSLVMYHFEKALYENPDQDLTTLWWDIVEKYQKVPRPEGRTKPDWATKDHIVTAPVYYHNYVLGQMFQDQLVEKLAEIAGESDPLKVIFRDRPELGQHLIEQVFRPGASMPWPEFVEKSTGKPIGVDAYVGALTWGMKP